MDAFPVDSAVEHVAELLVTINEAEVIAHTKNVASEQTTQVLGKRAAGYLRFTARAHDAHAHDASL